MMISFGLTRWTSKLTFILTNKRKKRKITIYFMISMTQKDSRWDILRKEVLNLNLLGKNEILQ